MAVHPDGGASLLLVAGASTYVSRYDAQASLIATEVYTEDLALDLASTPDGSLRVLFGPPMDVADPDDPARASASDGALLQRIAASPADFLNAPDGEDLVGIYRRLAAQIACGP